MQTVDIDDDAREMVVESREYGRWNIRNVIPQLVKCTGQRKRYWLEATIEGARQLIKIMHDLSI